MRSLPFLLLLAMVWSFCSVAWGDDFIVSRTVLEDRSGTLSIEEAVQAKFLPSEPILSKGYTDSVHWLRIVVRPRADGGELILRIRPAFLDEIKLYEAAPSVPGGWKTRVTGDRTPYLERERASMVLGFAIKPAQPENVYYLRLKTTSTSLLNVEALAPHQAQIKDMRLTLYQTVYLGFMLALLVWAVNDYLSSRQRVVAWFGFHQATYIALNFAFLGAFAPLLESYPPDLVDHLTSLMVWANCLFSAIFHRVLLVPFAPSKFIMRGFDAMVLVMLSELAIMAFGYVRLALHINALMVVLFIPVGLALAFSTRKDVIPGRRVLRTVYSLQAVSLVISQLPVLGWVKAIEWNLNVILVLGSITASLMFILLHLRSRQLVHEGQQALLKLALTRQQLDIERTQREAQNRFMSMLNHELKTPLSVIRMALGMKQTTAAVKNLAQQSVRDVDAIIERCLQTDQLEQKQLAPRRQPCRVDQLLAELRSASATPQRLMIQSETLPALETDPQLLRIAVGNLIDNALKYAEPQSAVRIDVSLFEHQGRSGILKRIANASGTAGMPDPQRVFDKYYRAPGAQGKTGSGLGLYLVRSVIEQLGGWIRYCPFENEVRFELWIPL